LVRLKGISLIDHRWVDHIHHQPALAEVRRDENYAVDHGQIGLVEAGWLSAGRLFDAPLARQARLLAVEGGQRPTAGCSRENAPLETGNVTQENLACRKIKQGSFMLKTQIVADGARPHRP